MNFLDTYRSEQNNFVEIFNNTKVIHLAHQDELETDMYFRQLAASVGIPLIYEEDPVTGQILVDQWTKIKYNAEKSSDAYKHSNKSQPLHTDYNYFSFEIYASFLYCMEQAKFGGATTFIDLDVVVHILKEFNPLLLEQLQTTKVTFGRGINPIATNTDYILSKDEIGWKINWSYFRASTDLNNKTLIDDFKDFLDTYIEKSGELSEIKLQPGEGVFWHDRRILHGRNSFFGNRQLNKGGIAKEVPEYVMKQIIGS